MSAVMNDPEPRPLSCGCFVAMGRDSSTLDSRYLRWSEDIEESTGAGGKAHALARLARARFPVPEFFVVLPEACIDSLAESQRIAFAGARDAETRAAILANCLPQGRVVDEINVALKRLRPDGEPVAVRSSASSEDGALHSFAGQLESFLFVHPADAAERIAAVWRSGFAQRVRAYRKKAGLDSLPTVPAVIVQRMVSPTASGIAFSADPISMCSDVALVAVAEGSGEALAAGETSGSTWRVDSAGGIESMGSGRSREAAELVLDRDTIARVATLARQAKDLFGCPQDVEWCVSGRQLHLLQSRPITTLRPAIPSQDPTLWDNSNIVENYGGLTSPLTFSFIRQVYDTAYRALAREFGIPRAKIASHDALFRNMIGMFEGRIYYNLSNWYRMLALLPGLDANRRHLDRMLGVQPSAPRDPISAARTGGFLAGVAPALRFAGFAARMARHHFSLTSRVRRFRRRFDRIVESGQIDLSRRNVTELAADYGRLVASLKPLAAVPALNDFAAMIFGGTAQALLARWGCAPDSASMSALVCDGERSVTAAISRELAALARLARLDPDFVDRLCHCTEQQITENMSRWPEFRDRVGAYLAAYGDRGGEELKLESHTLRNDPLPLLRAIGRAARTVSSPFDATRESVVTARRKAEGSVRRDLRGKPLQRALLGWILRHARRTAAQREDLRFDRARFFARVRQILSAIGTQLAKSGVLLEQRDIFHLEVDEVFAFVEGRSSLPDLKAVVQMRRDAWERFRSASAPPDRFLTRGLPYGGRFSAPPPNSVEKAASADITALLGIGCCPGRVRGRVRVVHDPRHAALDGNEILVTERTDPGWVILFGAAAGLIVERGNILSHAAIAAREFGLPTIVSVPRATAILKDGIWIEMDGTTGAITFLPSPAREG